MRKVIKDLCKLVTVVATVAGIAYIARDQIKAIIKKIKELLSGNADDDSFDDDSFEDDDIFPEPSDDDRDYVSINITEEEDEEPAAAEASASPEEA